MSSNENDGFERNLNQLERDKRVPHCFKCSAYKQGHFCCHTCRNFYCEECYKDFESGVLKGEVVSITRYHTDKLPSLNAVGESHSFGVLSPIPGTTFSTTTYFLQKCDSYRCLTGDDKG